MTLDALNKELIDAMKAGDITKRDVLRGAISNIKNAAIATKQRDSISEDLIDKVLLKEQKTLQEQIDTCPPERKDALKQYQDKMEVLKKYVPQLITDRGQIHDLILEFSDNFVFNKSNKGQIMRVLSQNLKGKADMRVVQDVLSQLLSYE